MRFAAIDIGSNAVRLLFVNVYEDDSGKVIYRKEGLVRVPVRLGVDVFLQGCISPQRAEMLEHSMKLFSELMAENKVAAFRACATAAMREAENGPALVQKIKETTGIGIEIVDGEAEAQIIFSNRIVEQLRKNKTYLYIDVGGGSTELSLFHKRKLVYSHSFPVGTLKMLHDRVPQGVWQELEIVLKGFHKKYEKIFGIGSGGNINTLHKIFAEAGKTYITKRGLKRASEALRPLTIEERMTRYDMREDRADVVIPALDIFLEICRHTEMKKIYVPKVGVSDGLIHLLYESSRTSQTVG